MKWLPATMMAAVALATADVLTKFTSGRVTTPLAVMLYGCGALGVGVGWVAWHKAGGGRLTATPIGAATAVGVGLAFGMVTLNMYVAYGHGAPISVASPIIRLSGLLLVGLVGVAALGEPLTWRYAIGVALSLVGVYLIITR